MTTPTRPIELSRSESTTAAEVACVITVLLSIAEKVVVDQQFVEQSLLPRTEWKVKARIVVMLNCGRMVYLSDYKRG